MGWVARFFRSVIGKKVVMAVSGILLVGFLLSHMASNVLVFKDPESLTHYGEWLRSFGPLLWVARLGLIALAVVHIVSALQLTRLSQQARPVGYQKLASTASTWGARSMRLGGLLLLAFIVFHLLHFTTGTIFPGAEFLPGEVGRNVLVGFTGQPLVVAFYVVAMLALGLHLSHGVWSFFQTLGLNHPHWNRARRVTAWVLTIAIAGGLLLVPIGVAAGWAGR
ncbi:MAG: succinate dehydrogenase cytochrome b subunit [Gemmatimonadales bacterium]|nr:succinate dehydrogenase cytochrome b subunit [Gemmatimonadales bacterium]